MEHNRGVSKNKTINIFSTGENLNSLQAFKIKDHILEDISPNPNDVNVEQITFTHPCIFKTEVTVPNDDCIMCYVFNGAELFLRVGNPNIQLMYYRPLVDSSEEHPLPLPFKRWNINGVEIESGDLEYLGADIYRYVPNSLAYSIIRIENEDYTLDVPYNEIVINPGDNVGHYGEELFLDTGFSTYGFIGEKHSYFDLLSGQWSSDPMKTAKASDLAKAVAFNYGLEWEDRTSENHIYNFIKYFRTYDENNNVFRLYAPAITPENNVANFDLIEEDELGNTFIKGISMLLERDLVEISPGKSGVILSFRNK